MPGYDDPLYNGATLPLDGTESLVVLQDGATREVTVADLPLGSAAPPPYVDVLTGTGTWTKPTAPAGCAAYTRFRLRMWGGASGGASGRKGLSTTARAGGGAGEGGYFIQVEGLLTGLGSTVAYAAGAGGAAGASQTANSTDGNPGTVGTESTFGPFTASGGAAPLGGTATVGTAGSSATQTVKYGARSNLGGNSIITAAPTLIAARNDSSAAVSGGSGGGMTAANVAFNGGSGGTVGATGLPSGGVVDGAAPVNATEAPAGVVGPGPGGSGGAASTTTNAQAGNAGSGIAAGGGGGGASTDAIGNSGAGGAGTAGAIEIVVF